MPPEQNSGPLPAHETERIAAVTAIVDAHFPSAHDNGRMMIEALPPHGARVRLEFDARNLRPGNSLSGPAMFKLADWGVWVAVISVLGEAGIEAVTTSLTMNFLRRPDAGDLIADIELLKLGRRLAVAEVRIWREDPTAPVAHATATYAVPGNSQT